MVQILIQDSLWSQFINISGKNYIMPHMLGDHGSWVIDDGNHVIVSNHNEIISIVAPMTRVNA